ncbi:hypothetical protein [Marinobacter subterrani]|uniref:Uncharacterized protein n=1 Tax=Marinobacter subterrani TaxID=1658765 RepID=A0A0J7J6G8_9GAMM|nr:hypothetical protein [Marinobacter subterrani]KMQ73772.1 hypothetical protein Msub_20993 [Marinobacter subterrani]
MTETCTTDASPVLPRVAARRRLLNTVADLQRQRRTAVPGPLICVAMNAANEQDKAKVANNLAGLQTTGYLDVQPLRDNPIAPASSSPHGDVSSWPWLPARPNPLWKNR